MEHLLFAAYLIFFAWLVTRVKFFINSGLTNSQLVIFFLLKVMAGILYGWIGVYYGELAQMVDTWAYHYESIKETALLRNDPGEFFGSLFQNNYSEGYGKFFSSEDSWWNDLKSNFFIKLLAVFNLLSFGNYYINVVFYSFLSLFGPVALFRVMQDVFPGKRIAIILATFLIPSFLYWTSGLHKEGLIFVGFGLVIFNFYFGLKKGFGWKKAAGILLGLLIVLVLRNFLIIVILPALLTWWIAERSRFKPIWVFTVCYLVFFLLFFSAKYIHPKLDFPQAVVNKQQAFLKLHGGSSISVDQLEPNFLSFIVNTPQALILSTVRPFPSDVRHLLSMAASMEVNFLLFLFVVFLFRRTNGIRMTGYLLTCLFLSFSILLMIGFSVNNLGAIVRYRSIVLPFLIIPIVARIDWGRIYTLLFENIDNKNNI